jgi:hypothetical protein
MKPGTSTQIHYPLAEWLEDLDYYARKCHYEKALGEIGPLPPEVTPWILRRLGLTKKSYDWRLNTVRVGYLYLLQHLDILVPGSDENQNERELTALTKFAKNIWPWIDRNGLTAQFYYLPLNAVIGLESKNKSAPHS